MLRSPGVRGPTLTLGVLILFEGCTIFQSPGDNAPPASCDAGPATGLGFGGGDWGSSSGCNPGGGSGQLDATANDDGGPESGAGGTCNGAPCSAGCTCELGGDDAGGGTCACLDAGQMDAATDVGEQDVSIDAPEDDALDSAVLLADAAGDATTDADTGVEEPSACGVITCGAGCTCVSVMSSDCVCP